MNGRTSCTNLALVINVGLILLSADFRLSIHMQLWQVLQKCPSSESKGTSFTSRTRAEQFTDCAVGASLCGKCGKVRFTILKLASCPPFCVVLGHTILHLHLLHGACSGGEPDVLLTGLL